MGKAAVPGHESQTQAAGDRGRPALPKNPGRAGADPPTAVDGLCHFRSDFMERTLSAIHWPGPSSATVAGVVRSRSAPTSLT